MFTAFYMSHILFSSLLVFDRALFLLFPFILLSRLDKL
ncbi:hypothetical protein QY97_01902 [Bacillus thermotolerans]|uniref:Uncharacterized protein n=1 Tax=Bacillus thermotolerans TaxID=1221996 RepID=A0A0F5I147_BACTR|nr:hypothetical protein QY97_01902 [Bacillus thermotolerans]KKB39394.1 hypothetical protein QY95_02417 [Bacillus thermotolerans]